MNAKNILSILNQVWGPTKISFDTKCINLISQDLIDFHIRKIKSDESIDSYNVSDLFSLYFCLNFIIENLWIHDEYSIVLWEDLFQHGYKTLLEVKSAIMKFQ